MKMKVDRAEVWAATIEDRPGALAEKLESLSGAGANLEFLIARRTPERAGQGVVFVTPLKGSRQIKAAQAAGFQKTESLQSLRVEGVDKPGVEAKLTRALAESGINLRGLSAAAIGRRCVTYIALDDPKDAAKASALLKKLG